MEPFENAEVGAHSIIEAGVEVGFRYAPDCGRARLGRHAMVRRGTVIYGDVVFGDYFQTGHNAVVRARVNGGDHCCVFHHVVLEGLIRMGSGVRLMANVYVPSRTEIGDDVFIGPGTTLLNDPLAARYEEPLTPRGPVIEADATIGGGCTILPGVRIGRGSFVAAGSLVTRDVPPESLAIGSPARIRELPEKLRGKNCRALTRAEYDLWHPGAG